MTTISGKLYQMKNAAGTENRFPMTVIEGVYGLSTYLQDQFSALQNIYMPIDGIYEGKPSQEFVYRQTPNTIGANLLNIDRIKGKTLVWNQLIPIPTSSQSVSYSGATITDNRDGSYTIVSDGTNAELDTPDGGFAFSIQSEHKFAVWYSGNNVGNSLYLRASNTDSLGVGGRLYEGIHTNNSGLTDITAKIRLSQNTACNQRVYINIVDLTILGIDNLTTVAEVEAWLATNVGLRSYYPHNAGELKSNDAQSIVTEGRNQWDEEYNADTDAISSKNNIPVLPNTEYYFKIPSGWLTISEYDSNGNPITSYSVANTTHTTSANCAYIRFITSSAYGAVYNHDICINISDASFNGQYEPYWKNTLELNIKTLTGKKDGQGASVTIFPDGACGVGSVYDELRKSVAYKRFGIVDLGNLSWNDIDAANGSFRAIIAGMKQTADTIVGKTSKYAPSRYGNGITIYNATEDIVFVTNGGYAGSAGKLAIRDSSFANYTVSQVAAALTGVKFIFELATPETYVLDTPLVTAMRAGTTEERISPNSDGLSAPFCGDLIYSVSAASDALDAQYATAAGKLYNKRKIWGQDFDGTQDVTGLATMGNGAKVSSVLTIPTSAPASEAVASGECALYIDTNGNYSQ